jgi:4a-hydroxytetrahydrobiopterin dehydratase
MSWKEKNNTIHKTFKFHDFEKALNFVNAVGTLAEQRQHHPDIYIHDYNQVDILLTTHDEGKVTDKDYSMAESIDKIK